MTSGRLQRATRASNLSLFEQNALLSGLALTATGALGCVGLWTVDGGGRFMGLSGLLFLLVSAVSRGVRVYRAGARASVPKSVGRTRVRVRPSRWFGAVTISLGLVLPAAAVGALLVLVSWAWLPVAAVLLLGSAGLWVSRRERAQAWQAPPLPDDRAVGLLERLAFLADIPAPAVSVEYDARASAWTSGGTIYVTTGLLRLLSDRELEAVLAHEVGHLARRDAAVMEICSAPSRLMLRSAELLLGLARGSMMVAREFPGTAGFATVLYTWGFVACTAPPAYVVGWIARLSVLGMSRAREFAADAAAVALSGNPSALASALMKLEEDGEWAPHADLRQAAPDAALCIVAPVPVPFGRLLSTHPVTARRVGRLQALESRLQHASSS